MAILYTFIKSLDNHIIEVSQITVYELFYLSDNSNALILSETLAVDTPITLTTVKDGQYKLILLAPGEPNVEILFDVIKYLQDSIIKDSMIILCDAINTDCKDTIISQCIKKAAKDCLTHKSIFVKLLTFQTLYIPTYGVNYSLIFCNFLEEGALTYNCKLQTTINRILLEECVTGTVKDVTSLFKMFVALYWAGMYFIEKNLAFGDSAQLTFIDTKFMYDCIVACLCNTCIDINELEAVFTIDPSLSEITFFQYDNTSDDINDIAKLTPAYLDINGQVIEESALLAGVTIIFTNIGRIGFIITNVTPDKYSIYDVLNNDITDTVFDKVYDVNTLTQTYCSKEFYVPSSVYFKFLIN